MTPLLTSGSGTNFIDANVGPVSIPMSHGPQIEQLNNLLSSLSSGDYQLSIDTDDKQTALQQVGIDLLGILGYSGANVFLDLIFETNPRVKDQIRHDEIYFGVVVADEIGSPPYITIKTFSNPQPSLEVIHAAAISSGARYTIALSEEYLIIGWPSMNPEAPRELYKLSEISESDIEHIRDLLSPPDELPTGRAPKFPPGYHPDQTKLTRWLFTDSEITPEYKSNIQTEHFELDIDEYADLLYEAFIASESNEKGDALEDVAAFLFEGLEGISIRDRNLRTESREIDLVLEHTESPAGIFSPSSRFVLVECKNKQRSMSVQEVDNFIGSLRDTGIELGIIISWHGVSGEDSDTDAMGAIKNQNGRFEVVTLSSRDLYRILDGETLYEIIDRRLYAQQFNL